MPGPKKIILNSDGLIAMGEPAIQMQTWEKLIDRTPDKKLARSLEDKAMDVDHRLLAAVLPAIEQYKDWNRELSRERAD